MADRYINKSLVEGGEKKNIYHVGGCILAVTILGSILFFAIGGKSDSDAATQSKGDGNDLQSFNQNQLKIHNAYRSKHGVPPLVLDQTMITEA